MDSLSPTPGYCETYKLLLSGLWGHLAVTCLTEIFCKKQQNCLFYRGLPALGLQLWKNLQCVNHLHHTGKANGRLHTSGSVFILNTQVLRKNDFNTEKKLYLIHVCFFTPLVADHTCFNATKHSIILLFYLSFCSTTTFACGFCTSDETFLLHLHLIVNKLPRCCRLLSAHSIPTLNMV